MGSLRERSPGVWQARVYNGLDPVSGKRRYAARTIHARTRKAAETELRKLERQVTNGRVPRGTTARTFGEQLDRWHVAKRPRLSPGSQSAYAAAVKLLGPLRNVPLGRLTAEDLDSLYTTLEAKGKADATIRRVHNIARAVLDQAVRHDLIERNPADRAEPPPVRAKATRPPTLEELSALLQGAGDDQFAAFLFVAATTGARRGELAALRWRDVDLDAGTLAIRANMTIGRVLKDTKTHQNRIVALDEETVAVLGAHRDRAEELCSNVGAELEGERFVFTARPGSDVPLDPAAATRRFIRLCKRLNIQGVRLHDLRHFAGSQLIAAGVDIKTVQTRLGHSRPSTTLDVYTHAVSQNDQDAAAVIGSLVAARRRATLPKPSAARTSAHPEPASP
jgi:integrase